MNDFKTRYGSWALITGGTSGIGAALTKQLAQAGLNLVVVARTQSTLDAQAAALSKDFGVTVRTVAADLTQATGTATVIDAVKDLDIAVLVLSAAVESKGYFVDESLARHRALVQMDVVGPMELAHHFGGKMASRGKGAILLVSSLSGWMAQPYMAHYGAAKAYVMALGEGLHQEMKDKGVDVSVLSPGPTQTPMLAATGIDFGSMGMAVMPPEPVAAAGLAALGQRPHAVPGLRNQLTVFMMTRVMSRGLVGWLFKKMMGKALKLGPAKPAVA
jgi:short-subunit dehydrogenase